MYVDLVMSELWPIVGWLKRYIFIYFFFLIKLAVYCRFFWASEVVVDIFSLDAFAQGRGVDFSTRMGSLIQKFLIFNGVWVWCVVLGFCWVYVRFLFTKFWRPGSRWV